MTGPEQPDELAEAMRLADPTETHRRDPAIDDMLGRPPVGGWPCGCATCRKYRPDPLGEAGTTDPRAALIRTDPGRHAANRGPAYGPPVPEVEALPGVLHGVADRLEMRRWDGALEHRCPESREGWWFAVGLGTGVVLSGLLLLVVTLW